MYHGKLYRTDEFLPELVADMKDPVCPNKDNNCSHRASQHTFGRHTKCNGYVPQTPRKNYQNGMMELVDEGCFCTLTPDEVRYNRMLIARETIRKEE